MKKLEELGISPAPWRCICYNYKTNDKYNYLGEVRFADNSLLCCDIRQPDAKLAAAAPELYECLREAVDLRCAECPIRSSDFKCPHGLDKDCIAMKWRAVLSKASGEDK